MPSGARALPKVQLSLAPAFFKSISGEHYAESEESRLQKTQQHEQGIPER